jgi:glycosyltransferase involved in cell wall biosynthesis
VRNLADRGCNVQLWIAGGRAGNYEPVLRREIADLGLEDQIRLVGHLDREGVAKLVSAADIFCMASEREGWPNVVHEALACGTPVVATKVGGVPEMIPSEEYGTVVPPGDQEALSSALEAAMLQPWNRETIAALGRARSWPQVAMEVVHEMERVSRESRGG